MLIEGIIIYSYFTKIEEKRVLKIKKKKPKVNFWGKLFSWAYKLKPTRHILKKFIFNPSDVPCKLIIFFYTLCLKSTFFRNKKIEFNNNQKNKRST